MPYTGRDGLTHQETIIDWDKSLSVKTFIPCTAEEMAEARKAIAAWREKTIADILAIPAEWAGERYLDFVNRDFEKKKISWHENMIRDPSISFEALRDMITILEKRAELFKNNDLSLKTPQVNR